jgi:predicted dehydrogenase
MHLPAILAAASAGKHVLCEKPLVLNVDEAIQALRACRDAGVVLMTGNGDRFEPHARIVKSIIENGLLGQVNLVLERHMLHKDIIAQAARGMEWKLKREMAGGGSLHRDGVYYIDSLRYWAGSEVAHVTGAELDNFLWEPEEIETTAHVLFRFESGAIGVFDMVWCLHGPHKREIVINGAEGSLTLTGGVMDDATVTVHSRRLSKQILDDPYVVHSFEACYDRRPDQVHPDRVGEALVIRVPHVFPGGVHAEQMEFLAAIREGREPESSGLDGARDLELVEGAYRAFEQRRTIDFPLVDWDTIIGSPNTGNG